MIETIDRGDVLEVRFARPERRNALTRDGLNGLRTAVTDAEQAVVLLRGAGEAFCAGADLDTVSGLDREAAAEFARRGQRTATAIADADAAVVAGIDGAARGGGVELALACDLRVATPDATLAETGVRLGLFGAWGGTVRLPEIVGEGEALDLALSGRTLDAEESRRIGLVTRIVEEPLAVARELATNDSAALRVLKERVRDDASVAEREAAEADAFAALVDRNADEIAERRDRG